MAKNGKAYQQNKAAKVGESISCAYCGKTFIKKQYSQAFCCGKCKDRYWNRKGDRHHPDYYWNYNEEHPERIEFLRDRYIAKLIPGRTKDDEAEREAYREYMTNPKFREYVNDGIDMADGSWDAHNCSTSLATELNNFLGLA